MRIEQVRWTESGGWEPDKPGKLGESVDLVLIFGSTSKIKEQFYFKELGKLYPGAVLFGCTTAGEICGLNVTDNSFVITAVDFKDSKIKGHQIKLKNMADSFITGEQMGEYFEKENLVHVFVLSDGLHVNGSDLVDGLIKSLPGNVTITGGLSGDGERFKETYVFCNSLPEQETVAALGFYGNKLKIGYGSMGGWDSFGPERLITRSEGNILYELDGQSALELYKKYLGNHANDLPATGLLFPLSIRNRDGETGLVRTILAIDEEKQSMIFAGDVPEGFYARLMKANFDRLIDGAIEAAKVCSDTSPLLPPELAILISCVGRKMVLKQRIEEEVEGVSEYFGNKTELTGFYSYGEISPFSKGTRCSLHNQTMTITTITEG